MQTFVDNKFFKVTKRNSNYILMNKLFMKLYTEEKLMGHNGKKLRLFYKQFVETEISASFLFIDLL